MRTAQTGALMALALITSFLSAEITGAQQSFDVPSNRQHGGSNALPSTDPNQYRNLADVKLECSPHLGEPPILGLRRCNDLKTDVVGVVKERLQKEVDLRYQGKRVLDWKTGQTENVPVPVCNLFAGEDSKNNRGQSCGEFCRLSVDTGITGGSVSMNSRAPYCARERAWFHGFQLQSRKYFIAQVAREFKETGKIRLSKMDGEPVCHPMAADVLFSQKNHLNKNIDVFSAKYGREKGLSIKCDSDHASTSNSACTLQAIEKRLVNLWARVIRCEGLTRAKIDFGSRASNPEALQSRAQSYIEPICRDTYNADCTLCRDSTRTSRLNRCYSNELGRYLKNEFRVYENGGEL